MRSCRAAAAVSAGYFFVREQVGTCGVASAVRHLCLMGGCVFTSLCQSATATTASGAAGLDRPLRCRNLAQLAQYADMVIKQSSQVDRVLFGMLISQIGSQLLRFRRRGRPATAAWSHAFELDLEMTSQPCAQGIGDGGSRRKGCECSC